MELVLHDHIYDEVLAKKKRTSHDLVVVIERTYLLIPYLKYTNPPNCVDY